MLAYYPPAVPASYRPRGEDSRLVPAQSALPPLATRSARPASVVQPLPAREAAQGTVSMPVHSTAVVKARLQRVAATAGAQKAFARLPHEPDDARMTGVTRSLHRRLLALNIGGTLSPRHAA